MISNNEKGGYDVEFVGNEPNDVICIICLFVLREPMQAEQCGHRFCKSCIEDLKNRFVILFIMNVFFFLIDLTRNLFYKNSLAVYDSIWDHICNGF